MFANVRRIAVVGDLHGNPEAAVAAVRHAREHDAQLVVQLGDFGFWPDDRKPRTRSPSSFAQSFLGRVGASVSEAGIPLLWIRGNHEDHPRLYDLRAQGEAGDQDLWESLAANVWHWPDGLALNIGGARWLAVGGAHSVDRAFRVAGKSWFPEEKLTADQIDTIARAGHFDVDVVVAHEAPIGVPFLRRELRQHLPPHRRAATVAGRDRTQHLDVPDWPIGDLHASDEYQRQLRRIFDGQVRHGQFDPELGRLKQGGMWFHGHHHVAYTDELNDRMVQGLGTDGDRLDALVAVVDAAGRSV